MKHLTSLLLLTFTWTASAQESCPNLFDSNSNGAVDIEDFLAVLSLFSDVDSDSDGIWDSQDDCIDLEACNYAASPSEPCAYLDVLGACGGGCEGDGDGDGICDDEDDCVGVVDECGVCNGPGPTEVVIEDITILYDSVYLPQLEEWYVYEFGADTTFSYACAPFFGDCGDPMSYQGYDYATVLIGEQCWFAENLRNENYNNGDEIAANLNGWAWRNNTTGAVAVHGEGEGDCWPLVTEVDVCDEEWSLHEYGRLYNWHAVEDARGLCPSGWHVPSDGEWMTMEMALGMSESEANNMGWRGTDQGVQIKSDSGWYEVVLPGGAFNDGGGSNSSGFKGLPGGFRAGDYALFGYYGNGGHRAYWWSSSASDSAFFNTGLGIVGEGMAWFREVAYNKDNIGRESAITKQGYSVRCVRDAE